MNLEKIFVWLLMELVLQHRSPIFSYVLDKCVCRTVKRDSFSCTHIFQVLRL